MPRCYVFQWNTQAKEIIWVQKRQCILHFPIYLQIFLPWRRGKNTRPDDALAWTQSIPSHSGSRAQMNINVVTISAVTLSSLLSRPGKSCSNSYFRSEVLWAVFQAGQSALLPAGYSTETSFRWELQESTSETWVTRPTGRCIRSEKWGRAIAGQIQYFF